jgi:hypothetical protein
MGRWSYTKFVGTRGKIITVITAYQVCNTPFTTTKKKSRTAAAQHASMMRQQGITGTHPCKQFHKDLLYFLQACKSQREELLLAGDFNQALGTNISGMTKSVSTWASSTSFEITTTLKTPQPMSTALPELTTHLLLRTLPQRTRHVATNISNIASLEITEACSLTSTLIHFLVQLQ